MHKYGKKLFWPNRIDHYASATKMKTRSSHTNHSRICGRSTVTILRPQNQNLSLKILLLRFVIPLSSILLPMRQILLSVVLLNVNFHLPNAMKNCALICDYLMIYCKEKKEVIKLSPDVRYDNTPWNWLKLQLNYMIFLILLFLLFPFLAFHSRIHKNVSMTPICSLWKAIPELKLL